MPSPTNLKALKSFLRMTSYYRKFICDYAKVAKPLTNLTRGEHAQVKASQSKNISISLDEEGEKAFDDLKTILAPSEVLAFPDFSKPFHLTTDASNYAIGAVLSQSDDGERPSNRLYFAVSEQNRGELRSKREGNASDSMGP